MAYSIMLDAGHGGQDPGAVYKGRQEKNDNLKLALAVGEILKNKGIDISYTRTGDVYQTPFENAQLATTDNFSSLLETATTSPRLFSLLSTLMCSLRYIS